MREGLLRPGGTHPAVLVDGPESLHGNISDVAPPEEDFPCGGKRCKGSEEVKQVIERYIFNLRSIHGDTLHTGAAQKRPPSELKCQHCQFAEKLQLQLRQQALSLELNSWRGRGFSAGVSKQGKK